jgi:hypothetical protein
LRQAAEVNRFCACGDCAFCRSENYVELTKAEMNQLCALLSDAARLAELVEFWRVALSAYEATRDSDGDNWVQRMSAAHVGCEEAQAALLAFDLSGTGE